MKIVCPSRKRAKIFKTNITDMVVLVDKQEEQEYKDALNFEVITHDSLPSLSEIRQYAYDLFGDVFFVDDDIVSIERLYTTDSQQLNPDQVRDLIYRTQEQAEEIGAFLYGFNNDPVPAHYNEFKPFMMNGYINGCAMGLNKGGHLYFDKRTVACESHWINCLNAYYNRFCFIDKRFHFRQLADSTFTLQGGQSGRRTLETEKQDTLFLRKMFGNSIEVKKEQNKTKQLLEGIYLHKRWIR